MKAIWKVFKSSTEQYWGVLSNIEKYSKVLLSSIEKDSEILWSNIEEYWGGRVGTITRLLIISRQAKKSHQTPSQVPRPTCVWEWVGATVYTLEISLWGIPAPKFALEPLKKMVYWISLCIRKPQSQFHKISATHVSPGDHFFSSPKASGSGNLASRTRHHQQFSKLGVRQNKTKQQCFY